MDAVLSVSEITDRLRQTLESRFPFVWVRGEVSNLSRAASGHIYFTLKDAAAQLQCVWFYARRQRMRRSENFDPLTGEVYDKPRPDQASLLANGREFICAGSIGVYAGRGQYQLVVEILESAGLGALAIAFEEQKARLALAGYFDPERKKDLPANPETIALITSPRGAAIHDFMELARNRGLSTSIKLLPVPVQGAEAAARIALAIDMVNRRKLADAIVLIRGGGSLEDLWAYNEEIVARAIYNSAIPVLTGIGHEVDTSIADLTADRRAATPSHAAQILWPLRSEMWQRLDNLAIGLQKAMRRKLDATGHSLELLARALFLASPQNRLNVLRLKLNAASVRLGSAAGHLLAANAQKLQMLAGSIADVGRMRKFLDSRRETLQWREKLLRNLAAQRQAGLASRLEALEGRLKDAGGAAMAGYGLRLERLENGLEARNPDLPLQKGYVLLYGREGLIHSARACARGEKVYAQLRDGRLDMIIESVEKTGADIHEK